MVYDGPRQVFCDAVFQELHGPRHAGPRVNVAAFIKAPAASIRERTRASFDASSPGAGENFGRGRMSIGMTEGSKSEGKRSGTGAVSTGGRSASDGGRCGVSTGRPSSEASASNLATGGGSDETTRGRVAGGPAAGSGSPPPCAAPSPRAGA